MGAYIGAIILGVMLTFGLGDIERQVKRIADYQEQHQCLAQEKK